MSEENTTNSLHVELQHMLVNVTAGVTISYSNMNLNIPCCTQQFNSFCSSNTKTHSHNLLSRWCQKLVFF